MAEFNEKNVVLDNFIASYFNQKLSKTAYQSDVSSESSQQPHGYLNNFDSTILDSVPWCSDFNTPKVQRNYLPKNAEQESANQKHLTEKYAICTAWWIINYRKIKTITKSNMLSYRNFMLGYIDENRMSRRYFVHVRSFPGGNIDDMFHHLAPLLEKYLDAINLHVGTTMQLIMKRVKLLKIYWNYKMFVLTKLAKCRIIVSRPIKRVVNSRTSEVIEDVTQQLKRLNINSLGNEKKNLGKKGLHLYQYGLKQFALNLIAGIKGLWKTDKSPYKDKVLKCKKENMDSDLFQNSQIATEEKSILEINSNNFDKNVFCTFNVEKNFNANLYKSANQHAKR